MAGIEKICEFSGDYPAYKMYGYKRNLIQICPNYRIYFRKKEAVLLFFKPELHDTYSRNIVWKIPFVWKLFKHINTKWFCGLISNKYYLHWDYVLIVPDVPGKVDGCYFNYTTNRWLTIFNIWRKLIRGKFGVTTIYLTEKEFFESVSMRDEDYRKVLTDMYFEE
jgi:hypothetical protein